MPSTREPVVLLFHTDETTHQYYGDGPDDDGVYWYSGMGAEGDMEWNSENRAVRDHARNGRDLLLFMRARREGGFWRYYDRMEYVGHRIIQRPDRTGAMRKAIVFGLLPISGIDAPVWVSSVLQGNDASSIDKLRSLALAESPDGLRIKECIQNILVRSEAVRRYALLRANGSCEACGSPAPFAKPGGDPFLEVHHLRRLADGGPDRPDAVAGVCPNCHRRCHYGEDADAFNMQLTHYIRDLESDKN